MFQQSEPLHGMIRLRRRRRARAQFDASLSDFTHDELLAVVSRLRDVVGAKWFRIDPYGGPEGPTERAAREVLRAVGTMTHRDQSCEIDPFDKVQLEAFVRYLTYAASADIAISGPGNVVLETNDGEWLGLDLTDDQLSRLGLDDNRWVPR